MQTAACFKTNGGIGQLPVSRQSQVTMVPWWIGAQPMHGENFGQLKSVTGNCDNNRDDQMSGQGPANSDKETGDNAKFSMVQENKDSGNGQKTQQHSASISLQSPFEYQGRFELGQGQSMACSNYSYVDQCFGLYATYGAQTTHGRMLLPPNLTADMPIYVNAKQYRGIVRRRQARAKAEMENKLIKVRKPYLHESRHRHAMRRTRGSGGRFLNTKKEGNAQQVGNNEEKTLNAVISTSPSSESGNLNSGSGGSSLSRSEATSIYPHDDPDHFRFIDHFYPPSYHRPADMMNGDHGTGMSTRWGAAATGGGRCDLVKV